MALWRPEDDARLRALHGEGRSLREVCEAMGKPPTTVSRHARMLELAWAGTPQTANAIAAHKERARVLRGELEAKTLEAASRLHAQLFAPTRVFNFGGKDNTYASRRVDEPPFADKAKIAGALAQLVATSVKLSEHDADYSVNGAKSMLTRLGEQLGLTVPEPEAPAEVDADA